MNKPRSHSIEIRPHLKTYQPFRWANVSILPQLVADYVIKELKCFEEFLPNCWKKKEKRIGQEYLISTFFNNIVKF